MRFLTLILEILRMKVSILLFVLLLTIVAITPADAKIHKERRLARSYTLTLQYTISGNIQGSVPQVCPYTLYGGFGKGSKVVYTSSDCDNHISTAVITNSGRNIMATIPFFVQAFAVDPASVTVTGPYEIDLHCSGSILRGGTLSANCSESTTSPLGETNFIISGTFNAYPARLAKLQEPKNIKITFEATPIK